MVLRRSREGAWIEITSPLAHVSASMVAPARERGLKFNAMDIFNKSR